MLMITPDALILSNPMLVWYTTRDQTGRIGNDLRNACDFPVQNRSKFGSSKATVALLHQNLIYLCVSTCHEVI